MHTFWMDFENCSIVYMHTFNMGFDIAVFCKKKSQGPQERYISACTLFGWTLKIALLYTNTIV